MKPFTCLIAALSLGLCACRAPSSLSGLDESFEGEFQDWNATTPEDVPLMARDGGVVEAPDSGTIVPGTPTHEMQPSGTGRMYILELYQSAIDERDALKKENLALNAAIEKLSKSADALRMKVAGFEQQALEQQQLITQHEAKNKELAARLVTAQIRRLEAEKLLYESKLEWQRASDGALPGGGGSASAGLGLKPVDAQ